MDESAEKSWSGRFDKPSDRLMEQFNASIGFDRRLYRVDIDGSRAQAKALAAVGVLNAQELDCVLKGLDQVEVEAAEGRLALGEHLEDIHMAVEARLIEIVGEVGGKLHTGRSRNDQVALDERLYLREATRDTVAGIDRLQAVLVDSADRHIDVLMPGYTHLQQAQPVRLSHYTMALFWMLDRDRGRFSACSERADAMPLGSGAFAGSAYPIDRKFLATELGFSRITENSIDAVSDRDYLLEYMSAGAIMMGHLSRFCEDLIVWSSSEFQFIELDDAYSTGSSMMPQKKNPDSLELIRGKTGRVYGNLMSLLTVMKGLPLTYSKDLQEDKEAFFDTVDTINQVLAVFAGAWETMKVLTERMREALDGTVVATDLADYLVRKGLPFRETHRIVGRLVRKALSRGRRLDELDLATLRSESNLIEADVGESLCAEASVNRRELDGGTGYHAVLAQIHSGRQMLSRRSRGAEA
jgi:argininosuccinate lyase